MIKERLNLYTNEIAVGENSFVVQTEEYRISERSCKGDFLELTISKKVPVISLTLFELETTHQKKYYAKTLHCHVVNDIKQNAADYIKIFQALKEKHTELNGLLEEKLQDLAN